MRSYRPTRGPFTERPYYTAQDIEELCTTELKKFNLLPSDPGPIRIERFVEKRFSTTVVFESLGHDVLGYSRFGAEGVEAIVVASELAEERSQAAERRINATLAHEAGHCLLQGHLFSLRRDVATLFGNEVDPKAPQILCRTGTVAGVVRGQKTSYDGRWWEYQANLCIGSFLLPGFLVDKAIESILDRRGILGKPVLPLARREAATAVLAEVFEVNPAAARIRLEERYPQGAEQQLTL